MGALWLLCWLAFSNVATNAGAAGVERCFFRGAITGVALEVPMLFSEFSCAEGGAEYHVGSIVGAVRCKYPDCALDTPITCRQFRLVGRFILLVLV